MRNDSPAPAVANVPAHHRCGCFKAPWLMYLFMFVVAAGLTVMCVRLQMGDNLLAIICASVTCFLLLSTGLCVYYVIKKREERRPDIVAAKGRKKTVTLKSHPFQAPTGEEQLSIVTCHICLTDLENGDKVVDLECGHIFHVDCATCWIKRAAICPACRFNIPVVSRSVSTSPKNVSVNV
jgi:hypothetical protein